MRGGGGWGGKGAEEGFDEGDVFVGGAGGSIDEEIIGRRPEDGGEELADHGGFFGPAPDDSRGAGGEEEGKGHGLEGTDGGRGEVGMFRW